MTTTTKEALKEFVKAVSFQSKCLLHAESLIYPSKEIERCKDNLLDALDKEPTRVDNPPVA